MVCACDSFVGATFSKLNPTCFQTYHWMGVQRERFVWLPGTPWLLGRWRCALRTHGEECVPVAGTRMRPGWCAGSWASL